MAGLIVVFPNKDNATNIRNLLARGGMDVIGVCTTGAQAMHYADTVDDGIVVCGYRMKDMMYTQLREYLPESFEMLLVASQDKWSSGDVEGIVGLSTPIKVYDLLNTVNMMLQSMDRRRKKRRKELKNRDPKQQETIRKAKELTDKPFGVIRYYRRPHTMEENIKKAIQLYSGDKPYGLFAEKLNINLKNMNSMFDQISNLFESAGVQNFEKLPKQKEDKSKFAQLFNLFNKYLEAAKIQRMTWDKEKYEFDLENGEREVITREIDEKTYLILVQRYKELQGGGSGESDSIPFDVETYITEIDTGLIDSDYMNSKFNKYLKALAQPDVSKEEVAKIKDELHKTFATLSVEEQKYANLILHDIDSGDFKLNVNEKSFRDCITEYISNAKNDQIHKLSMALGLNETLLREAVSLKLNESNLNEFGRFDKIVETVDKTKAKLFFENKEGIKLPPPKVNIRINKYLKEFILQGGFDIE